MNSKAFKEAVADIKSRPLSNEEKRRRIAIRDRIIEAIDAPLKPHQSPSWVDTIRRGKL